MESLKWNWIFSLKNVYLPGFQTEDGTHPTFVVFICMGCGENFDRSWTLEEIRLHEATCAVKKPKYQTTCRFCGSISSLFVFVFSLGSKLLLYLCDVYKTKTVSLKCILIISSSIILQLFRIHVVVRRSSAVIIGYSLVRYFFIFSLTGK